MFRCSKTHTCNNMENNRNNGQQSLTTLLERPLPPSSLQIIEPPPPPPTTTTTNSQLLIESGQSNQGSIGIAPTTDNSDWLNNQHNNVAPPMFALCAVDRHQTTTLEQSGQQHQHQQQQQPKRTTITTVTPEIELPSRQINHQPSTLPVEPSVRYHTQFLLFTLGLSLMVTLNAALLIWIISFLNFSHFKIEYIAHDTHNMHTMDVTEVDSGKSAKSQPTEQTNNGQISFCGGIHLRGQLETRSLSAFNNQQIKLHSTNGIVFAPKNRFTLLSDQTSATADDWTSDQHPHQSQHHHSHPHAWLWIDPNKVVAYVPRLVVKSAQDDALLLLSQATDTSKLHASLFKLRVVLGVDALQLKSEHKMQLNSSIQVPNVYSQTQLYLYSPTRKIHLRGPKQISIVVPNRNEQQNHQQQQQHKQIKFTAKHSVHLISQTNRIYLNTSGIHFSKQIRTVYPVKVGSTYPSIGQLCVCARTGKVFIAPSQPGQCFHTGLLECTTNSLP